MNRRLNHWLVFALGLPFVAVGCGGNSQVPDARDTAADKAADIAADNGADNGPDQRSGGGDAAVDIVADALTTDIASDDGLDGNSDSPDEGGDDGAGEDRAEAGGADTQLPPPPLIQVPLYAQHMIADRQRQRLYLSVAGAAPDYPNTIVVMNAQTGTVISSIPIGSNPDTLAISDDDSTLWVGIDGALAIRRITLGDSPPTVGPLIKLPTVQNSQPPTAGAIAVLRGASTTIAVAVRSDFGRTVILDDGVPRETAALPVGAFPIVAGPVGYLFAYNNQNTGFDFFTLTVLPTGLGAMSFSNLIAGFNNDILYQEGHVFADSGEIVDVSDPAHPISGGKFAAGGAIAGAGPNRLVMLASAANAVYQGPTQILVLDINGKKTVATINLADDLRKATAAGVWDPAFLGGDTLAFMAASGDGLFMPAKYGLIIVHDPALAAAN